ncbi:MAG: hypothetical protein ACLU8W_08985 [Clostridia bacterium]
MARKTGKTKAARGNVRRLLSSYAASVILILCAAALAFGASTAADRTRTVSFGEQAVAAAASPVEKLGESTVKMPDYIRQIDLIPLARSLPSLCGPVVSNLAYGIAETAELLRDGV